LPSNGIRRSLRLILALGYNLTQDQPDPVAEGRRLTIPLAAPPADSLRSAERRAAKGRCRQPTVKRLE